MCFLSKNLCGGANTLVGQNRGNNYCIIIGKRKEHKHIHSKWFNEFLAVAKVAPSEGSRYKLYKTNLIHLTVSYMSLEIIYENATQEPTKSLAQTLA